MIGWQLICLKLTIASPPKTSQNSSLPRDYQIVQLRSCNKKKGYRAQIRLAFWIRVGNSAIKSKRSEAASLTKPEVNLKIIKVTQAPKIAQTRAKNLSWWNLGGASRRDRSLPKEAVAASSTGQSVETRCIPMKSYWMMILSNLILKRMSIAVMMMILPSLAKREFSVTFPKDLCLKITKKKRALTSTSITMPKISTLRSVGSHQKVRSTTPSSLVTTMTLTKRIQLSLEWRHRKCPQTIWANQYRKRLSVKRAFLEIFEWNSHLNLIGRANQPPKSIKKKKTLKNDRFQYEKNKQLVENCCSYPISNEKKLNARENIEPNIYLKIIILLHLYT